MIPERRKSPRSRARTDVVVVCDDGLTRLAAVVVDTSESGMRLRLADDKPLHGDCYILFERRMEPCRVVWQARQSVGLHFAR